eukprot:COSAG01_NODE_8902_length_2621_cov_1.775178_4_plen_60_part_00
MLAAAPSLRGTAPLDTTDGGPVSSSDGWRHSHNTATACISSQTAPPATRNPRSAAAPQA